MSARPSHRARMRLMITLAVLAVLAAASWMVLSTGSLFPPRTVVMATGPEGASITRSAPATFRSCSDGVSMCDSYRLQAVSRI